jgi:hypothetical protein
MGDCKGGEYEWQAKRFVGWDWPSSEWYVRTGREAWSAVQDFALDLREY